MSTSRLALLRYLRLALWPQRSGSQSNGGNSVVYHTSMLAFISYRLFTAGDLAENLVGRDALAREVMSLGIIPLVPHFPFLDETTDRDKIMVCCKKMVEKCDILIYDHTKLSQGALEEIAHAQRNLIPVFDIKILRDNRNII